MKRKVYIKQMKMLKEKSKSQDKEQKKNPQLNQPDSGDPVNEAPTKSNDERTITTSSNFSTTTTVSSTPYSSTNNRPLPTVDVLMKSSTLRAFQLRQIQEQRHPDNEMPDSNTTIMDTYSRTLAPGHDTQGNNSPSASSSSMSSPPYIDNQGHFDNVQNVERWVEDCSTVEQAQNPSPRLAHQSYGMEYPGTYNVNDRTDVHTNEGVTTNGVQSPPPVFHQLQASRLNTDPSPRDVSEYTTEPEQNTVVNHKSPHGHYGVLPNGSDIPYHHQHPHDALGYSYNPPHHTAIHDDQLHEHHGQVRAWEQENYRYVDFTWRHSEGMDCRDESNYSESKSADEERGDHIIPHENSRVLDESMDLSNKKPSRPTTRSGGGSGGGRRRRKRVQTPVQRSAANMRERRRMCHLNVAFDYLKEHLPNVKDKKKLSRIQTLKAAIYYIHLLQDSLNVN